MSTLPLKFILYVVILTAICLVGQVIWNHRVTADMQLNHGLVLLSIFPVSVIVVHGLLMRSAKNPGGGFIRMFMVSTVLKFFVYISILFGFLLLSTENKSVLAVHFLAYYMLFSSLEVGMLYSELARRKKVHTKG